MQGCNRRWRTIWRLAGKPWRCRRQEALPYDGLLVATRSSPAVPPIKGLEAVKRDTFLSLDDALSWRSNDALLQVLILGPV